MLTVYLLRQGVPQPILPPVAANPAPYTVLYTQGGHIWAAEQNGQRHELIIHLDTLGGQVNRIDLAPDGRMLAITAGGGTEQGWLLSAPGIAAQPLLPPPSALAPGPLTFLDTVWPGPHSVTVLVQTTDGKSVRPLIGSYTHIDTAVTLHGHWSRPHGNGRAISLSPNGQQVLEALAYSGKGSFAGQTVIRLQHLDRRQESIALRYLGSHFPEAARWSPDGGTVAIWSPDIGLAIQKSSGRPVELVQDGGTPLAFSALSADLAYVSGKPGAWMIHVLELHGEKDQAFSAPAGAPQWLGWTPDARALLYVGSGKIGSDVWQIEPGSGQAVRILTGITGQVLGIGRTGTSVKP